MAFIGIGLKHDVARIFSSLDVPGEKVPTDQMHCTLAYLGKNVPIETVVRAISAVFTVTCKQKSFLMKVKEVKSFPAGEDGVPIIVPVVSPELLEFRSAVVKQLDKAKVEYSKKYEYNPHITLSYHDKEFKPIKLKDPIEWSVHEATIWGADEGDGGVNANFPFRVEKIKT